MLQWLTVLIMQVQVVLHSVIVCTRAVEQQPTGRVSVVELAVVT